MKQDHLFDRSPLADLWEAGVPEVPAPLVPAPPKAFCLKCGKVARVIISGRPAIFCGKTCRKVWIVNQNQWAKRYIRQCDQADKANPTEPTLFD